MERRRVDPLGSCGSSTISDPDVDPHAMYSSDEEDGGISFTTTETKCERLFEQGLELKVYGDVERALPFFLDCLKGMQECQYFAKLPQTLHHLGELYNSVGNMDIALEFMQAEKLFYEAILVSSAESKSKESSTKTKRRPFGRKRSTKTSGSNPAEYGDLLLKKANEYEMLARMCAKERKFDLAVDYSGKAAKLKRSLYGPDHPDTIASLENFSLYFAEQGGAEYAATLQKVDAQRTEPQITPGHVTTGTTTHCPLTTESAKGGQEAQDVTVGTPECKQALENLQPTYPFQDAETQSHTSECKQDSHTVSAVQGSAINESAKLSTHQQIDPVTMVQPCTSVAHTSPSELTESIHWSPESDNTIHGAEECLEVCVHKPELNIEHSRFCPLWVLLLGAFLEMALIAYMVYVR